MLTTLTSSADESSQMNSLKPCPFCGSGNVMLHVPYFANSLYTVRCYHCNCNIALFQTADEAIEAWNTRSYE